MDKKKVDIPLEVKQKPQLLKAEKAYREMSDKDLAIRYWQILKYLERKDDSGNVVRGEKQAKDGTRYKEEDWILALKKYELVEIEISRRITFGNFADFGAWQILRDDAFKALETLK